MLFLFFIHFSPKIFWELIHKILTFSLQNLAVLLLIQQKSRKSGYAESKLLDVASIPTANATNLTGN